MAVAMKSLNWNDITFVQYPTTEDPDDPDRVVPDDTAALTLTDALHNDQRLTITGGTGSQSQGSLKSTASAVPQSSSSSVPTSKSGDSGKAKGTPTPSATSVQLGPNVYGQTAAAQTCSNGNG
jgi:hypothetical protein